MAWNEPGGGNKDPWGGGNRGGNDQGPPDLDEAFRKLQEKLGGVFGGGSKGGRGSSKGGGGLLMGIAVIALVAYLWNAVFVVDQKEQAVILQLGKYSETLGPGLHMYFPPFQSKFQENVTQIRTYNQKQQMLTEDENIVEVSLSVQYNISSLSDYVLNVAGPIHSLEEATQSALRHEVGNSEMSKILTEGREVLQVEVQKRLQDYINSYSAGLNVLKVNIESTHPPQEVQAAFDDVIRAREDEQRSINKAQAYAAQVVPGARGQALRVNEEALGYKQAVVAQAEGESVRFSKLLTEYKKAPEVTRERLYLETIQQVLSDSNKVLLDVKGGNNMIYLPLDQLMKKNEAGNASSSLPQTLKFSDQEVKSLADQVADELRKRVDSSRTGRVSR